MGILEPYTSVSKSDASVIDSELSNHRDSDVPEISNPLSTPNTLTPPPLRHAQVFSPSASASVSESEPASALQSSPPLPILEIGSKRASSISEYPVDVSALVKGYASVDSPSIFQGLINRRLEFGSAASNHSNHLRSSAYNNFLYDPSVMSSFSEDLSPSFSLRETSADSFLNDEDENEVEEEEEYEDEGDEDYPLVAEEEDEAKEEYGKELRSVSSFSLGITTTVSSVLRKMINEIPPKFVVPKPIPDPSAGSLRPSLAPHLSLLATSLPSATPPPFSHLLVDGSSFRDKDKDSKKLISSETNGVDTKRLTFEPDKMQDLAKSTIPSHSASLTLITMDRNKEALSKSYLSLDIQLKMEEREKREKKTIHVISNCTEGSSQQPFMYSASFHACDAHRIEQSQPSFAYRHGIVPSCSPLSPYMFVRRTTSSGVLVQSPHGAEPNTARHVDGMQEKRAYTNGQELVEKISIKSDLLKHECISNQSAIYEKQSGHINESLTKRESYEKLKYSTWMGKGSAEEVSRLGSSKQGEAIKAKEEKVEARKDKEKEEENERETKWEGETKREEDERGNDNEESENDDLKMETRDIRGNTHPKMYSNKPYANMTKNTDLSINSNKSKTIDSCLKGASSVSTSISPSSTVFETSITPLCSSSNSSNQLILSGNHDMGRVKGYDLVDQSLSMRSRPESLVTRPLCHSLSLFARSLSLKVFEGPSRSITEKNDLVVSICGRDLNNRDNNSKDKNGSQGHYIMPNSWLGKNLIISCNDEFDCGISERSGREKSRETETRSTKEIKDKWDEMGKETHGQTIVCDSTSDCIIHNNTFTNHQNQRDGDEGKAWLATLVTEPRVLSTSQKKNLRRKLRKVNGSFNVIGGVINSPLIAEIDSTNNCNNGSNNNAINSKSCSNNKHGNNIGIIDNVGCITSSIEGNLKPMESFEFKSFRSKGKKYNNTYSSDNSCNDLTNHIIRGLNEDVVNENDNKINHYGHIYGEKQIINLSCGSEFRNRHKKASNNDPYIKDSYQHNTYGRIRKKSPRSKENAMHENLDKLLINGNQTRTNNNGSHNGHFYSNNDEPSLSKSFSLGMVLGGRCCNSPPYTQKRALSYNLSRSGTESYNKGFIVDQSGSHYFGSFTKSLDYSGNSGYINRSDFSSQSNAGKIVGNHIDKSTNNKENIGITSHSNPTRLELGRKSSMKSNHVLNDRNIGSEKCIPVKNNRPLRHHHHHQHHCHRNIASLKSVRKRLNDINHSSYNDCNNNDNSRNSDESFTYRNADVSFHLVNRPQTQQSRPSNSFSLPIIRPKPPTRSRNSSNSVSMLSPSCSYSVSPSCPSASSSPSSLPPTSSRLPAIQLIRPRPLEPLVPPPPSPDFVGLPDSSTSSPNGFALPCHTNSNGHSTQLYQRPQELSRRRNSYFSESYQSSQQCQPSTTNYHPPSPWKRVLDNITNGRYSATNRRHDEMDLDWGKVEGVEGEKERGKWGEKEGEKEGEKKGENGSDHQESNNDTNVNCPIDGNQRKKDDRTGASRTRMHDQHLDPGMNLGQQQQRHSNVNSREYSNNDNKENSISNSIKYHNQSRQLHPSYIPLRSTIIKVQKTSGNEIAISPSEMICSPKTNSCAMNASPSTQYKKSDIQIYENLRIREKNMLKRSGLEIPGNQRLLIQEETQTDNKKPSSYLMKASLKSSLNSSSPSSSSPSSFSSFSSTIASSISFSTSILRNATASIKETGSFSKGSLALNGARRSSASMIPLLSDSFNSTRSFCHWKAEEGLDWQLPVPLQKNSDIQNQNQNQNQNFRETSLSQPQPSHTAQSVLKQPINCVISPPSKSTLPLLSTAPGTPTLSSTSPQCSTLPHASFNPIFSTDASTPSTPTHFPTTTTTAADANANANAMVLRLPRPPSPAPPPSPCPFTFPSGRFRRCSRGRFAQAIASGGGGGGEEVGKERNGEKERRGEKEGKGAEEEKREKEKNEKRKSESKLKIKITHNNNNNREKHPYPLYSSHSDFSSHSGIDSDSPSFYSIKKTSFSNHSTSQSGTNSISKSRIGKSHFSKFPTKKSYSTKTSDSSFSTDSPLFRVGSDSVSCVPASAVATNALDSSAIANVLNNNSNPSIHGLSISLSRLDSASSRQRSASEGENKSGRMASKPEHMHSASSVDKEQSDDNSNDCKKSGNNDKNDDDNDNNNNHNQTNHNQINHSSKDDENNISSSDEGNNKATSSSCIEKKNTVIQDNNLTVWVRNAIRQRHGSRERNRIRRQPTSNPESHYGFAPRSQIGCKSGGDHSKQPLKAHTPPSFVPPSSPSITSRHSPLAVSHPPKEFSFLHSEHKQFQTPDSPKFVRNICQDFRVRGEIESFRNNDALYPPLPSNLQLKIPHVQGSASQTTPANSICGQFLDKPYSLANSPSYAQVSRGISEFKIQEISSPRPKHKNDRSMNHPNCPTKSKDCLKSSHGSKEEQNIEEFSNNSTHASCWNPSKEGFVFKGNKDYRPIRPWRHSSFKASDPNAGASNSISHLLNDIRTPSSANGLGGNDSMTKNVQRRVNSGSWNPRVYEKKDRGNSRVGGEEEGKRRGGNYVRSSDVVRSKREEEKEAEGERSGRVGSVHFFDPNLRSLSLQPIGRTGIKNDPSSNLKRSSFFESKNISMPNSSDESSKEMTTLRSAPSMTCSVKLKSSSITAGRSKTRFFTESCNGVA